MKGVIKHLTINPYYSPESLVNNEKRLSHDIGSILYQKKKKERKRGWNYLLRSKFY